MLEPEVLQETHGQLFRNQDIVLDGHAFIGCKMLGCRLIYHGGDYALDETIMDDCTWKFDGAAARVLMLLRAFHENDPNFINIMLNAGPQETPPLSRKIH